MKHPWLCFGVVGILVQALAYGQQSGGTSDTLSVNSGKIANVYSNECLGFSLPIPAGWELDTKVVDTDAQAKHIAGGGLTLLYLRPQGKPSGVELIHLIALDATGQASSVQDYVSTLANRQAHSVRQAHVEGPVVLKALIGTTGDVEDLTLVSGPELLVPAAMEAVRQWKYKPFLMGSEPVKMETQITVAFQIPGK